jgi:hypothetical protein
MGFFREWLNPSPFLHIYVYGGKMIGEGEVEVKRPRGTGKIMSENEANRLIEQGKVQKEGGEYSFIKTK